MSGQQEGYLKVALQAQVVGMNECGPLLSGLFAVPPEVEHVNCTLQGTICPGQDYASVLACKPPAVDLVLVQSYAYMKKLLRIRLSLM